MAARPAHWQARGRNKEPRIFKLSLSDSSYLNVTSPEPGQTPESPRLGPPSESGRPAASAAAVTVAALRVAGVCRELDSESQPQAEAPGPDIIMIA